MLMNNKLTNCIPDFLRSIEGEVSESTFKNRERHLKYFKQWLLNNELGDLEPKDLTKKDIKEYKTFLKTERDISKSTVQSYLRSLRYFLQFLDKEGVNCLSPEETCLQSRNNNSDVQKIVNHYFKTKGYSLEELKEDAKKEKIVYSRFVKPAKELLEVAESIEKAKSAITKVAKWADSRDLDYAIETVLKKWPELDELEPKKKKKKPFYQGNRMVKSRGQWYVIDEQGEWLEFAGKEKDINWKKE